MYCIHIYTYIYIYTHIHTYVYHYIYDYLFDYLYTYIYICSRLVVSPTPSSPLLGSVSGCTVSSLPSTDPGVNSNFNFGTFGRASLYSFFLSLLNQPYSFVSIYVISDI